MATRTSPVDTRVETVPSQPQEALAPDGFRKTSFFDPELGAMLLRDPVAQALQGSWRNRQQHGRTAYEQMLRHAAVSTPYDALLNVLKSIQVGFVAPQNEPTTTQKEMADFLNAQLKRLSWTKVVDGFFGNGYAFGFSLAEMTTRIETWKGRPFVQIGHLTTLPQASLDDGYPISSAGLPQFSTEPSSFTPNYTCFDLDVKGHVIGYHQYRLYTADAKTISWTTPQERLHILHFTHKAGDGNPFGHSILHPSFEHWADLYLLEKLEMLFLENAFPWLTASYDGDEPKPELHTQVQAIVSEQDPTKRLLIGNNLKFGKVTASDPDFVKHVEAKKRELRDYITHSMYMPKSMYRESGSEDDLDTRNLVQVFLKFTLPALLNEIGEMMTSQFGKRLVDSNWSNVSAEDYPRFRWRFVTPNDLRLVQSLVQMALPHIHSDKLGEVFADLIPGFEKEYIAKKPEDSVGVVRQGAIAAAGAVDNAGVNDGAPPPKEEGETRERTDGETENAGGVVGTSA